MRMMLAIVLCKLLRFVGKLVGKGSTSGQSFRAYCPGRLLP